MDNLDVHLLRQAARRRDIERRRRRIICYMILQAAGIVIGIGVGIACLWYGLGGGWR